MSEFERAWPWLAAALIRNGGTHTKEQIAEAIAHNAAQLHLLSHSAAVTYVQTHPSGLREGIFWLAGGDLDELVKAEPPVSQWFKSEGCHRSCIYGRRGFARKFPNFREAAVLLIKEL